MNPVENNHPFPQPSNTPKILYKFRYFDKKGYQIKLVSESELRFSSAVDFNDPFDSSLPYRFEDDPPGIQLKWIISAIKKYEPNTPKHLIPAKAQQTLKNMNSDFQYYDKISKSYVEKNYQNGICALTTKANDLLMWAHYSNDHKGFCVGIDSQKLLEFQIMYAKNSHEVVELLKVQYSDDFPNINFFQSMLKTNREWAQDILLLFSSKSRHWEYEEEYRLLLHGKAKVSVPIGHDAIKEIILGCKISKKNKDNILSIVKGLNNSIIVYQSEKSSTSFELNFKKIYPD